MKNISFHIYITLAILGTVLGLMPLPNKVGTRLTGLPIYQEFQVTNPVAYGAVMADGISTSTLTASSSPTFNYVYATSTTASSTFQMIDVVGQACVKGTTRCLGSGGSSGGVTSYFSTSTLTQGNDSMRAFTTVDVVSGDKLQIWSACTLGTAGIQLDVSNGSGTSTIARGNSFSSGNGAIALSGVYTASSTMTVFIGLDNPTDGTLRNCLYPSIWGRLN